MVTPANIEKMRKLILNGADQHPGILNFLFFISIKFSINLIIIL